MKPRARRVSRPRAAELPAPSPKPTPQTPEQIAKGSIVRRAKPSPVLGHVTLALTLVLDRALAERLAARAVREGVNIEAVIVDALKAELAE